MSDRKATVTHFQTNELKSTVIKIEVTHLINRMAYALSGYVKLGVGSGMIHVPLSTVHSVVIEPATRYSEKRLKTLAKSIKADDPRVIELAKKIAASGKVTIKYPEPSAEQITIDVTV